LTYRLGDWRERKKIQPHHENLKLIRTLHAVQRNPISLNTLIRREGEREKGREGEKERGREGEKEWKKERKRERERERGKEGERETDTPVGFLSSAP
jgi:hypothetical protein